MIARLRGARDQREEGVAICVELIRKLQEIDGVHGVHIMAFRQEHRVAEIVERSGVLGDRELLASTTTVGRAGRGGPDIGDQDMTETVVSSASRTVRIGFDRPFVIIGERINPTGRKFLPKK